MSENALISSRCLESMRYWWVNQNQTCCFGLADGCLCSSSLTDANN